MTKDERTGPPEEDRPANSGHHSHADDGNTASDGCARPGADAADSDFSAFAAARCDELRAARLARIAAERRRREEHRAARRIGVEARNRRKLAREEATQPPASSGSWPQREIIAEGRTWTAYGRWRR